MDFKSYMQEKTEVILENKEHEVVNLYNHRSDMKIKDISEKTGVSIGEIYRILKKYSNFPSRKRPNLSDHVKSYHQIGMGKKEIAYHTGYSERHIERIIRS